MNATSVKFSRSSGQDFYQTLRTRVNDYFETKGISRYANAAMVFKTIVMIGLYIVPYLLIVTSTVTNYWLVFATWVAMGIGISGIGLSIMHDANHGAYSSKAWINNALGALLNMLGGNAMNWKIQHNMLHHTYTNIDGLDEDIAPGKILRLSPHQPLHKIHRYQHIYGWFLYALMTVMWVTIKEFKQLIKWRGNGYFEAQGSTFGKALITLIFTKSIYFSYALVLPLVLTPTPWWLTLISFFVMHFIAGFILGIVFQPAHTVPDSEFPLPDDNGNIENTWAVHQVLTTSNFAPDNRLFSWFVGGLNYQVEHHLFTNICHIHYRDLSKIVRQTTEEFGLPYHSATTFTEALRNHGALLKRLGRNQDLHQPEPAKMTMA
jgi:linoleoyl-CoA desaturase